MNTYYCVYTKFFDSGRVKAVMYPIQAECKPENRMSENRMCDEYLDYFDTYAEARQHWTDAQNA